MKHLMTAMLVLMTGAVCRAAETQADFYVSPQGSDSWSGTLATPNAPRTDGPFATLERARDAVRDLKKTKTTDIVVLIREGTYQLKNTVVFGLEDSGVGDSTITYAAYPGETPVFSSGQEITGWKKVTGELPGLPKARRETSGWRMSRGGSSPSTMPKGCCHARGRPASFRFQGGSRNTLHFPEGRLKNWPNVEDVEILVRPHHAWIMNVLPLASVDEEAQIARTAIDATYAMNRLHFLKETESCWVENVLEELDEPGEWALNTKAGQALSLAAGRVARSSGPDAAGIHPRRGRIDKTGPKGHAGPEPALSRPDVHAWGRYTLPGMMRGCSTTGTCTTRPTRWFACAAPRTARSSNVTLLTVAAARSVWICTDSRTRSPATRSSTWEVPASCSADTARAPRM